MLVELIDQSKNSSYLWGVAENRLKSVVVSAQYIATMSPGLSCQINMTTTLTVAGNYTLRTFMADTEVPGSPLIVVQPALAALINPIIASHQGAVHTPVTVVVQVTDVYGNAVAPSQFPVAFVRVIPFSSNELIWHTPDISSTQIPGQYKVEFSSTQCGNAQLQVGFTNLEVPTLNFDYTFLCGNPSPNSTCLLGFDTVDSYMTSNFTCDLPLDTVNIVAGSHVQWVVQYRDDSLNSVMPQAQDLFMRLTLNDTEEQLQLDAVCSTATYSIAICQTLAPVIIAGNFSIAVSQSSILLNNAHLLRLTVHPSSVYYSTIVLRAIGHPLDALVRHQFARRRSANYGASFYSTFNSHQVL
jgi:hypothetical protein